MNKNLVYRSKEVNTKKYLECLTQNQNWIDFTNDKLMLHANYNELLSMSTLSPRNKKIDNLSTCAKDFIKNYL